MSLVDQLLQEWDSRFGPEKPGIIVRAPGRVNIIGEHTDYNEGFVLPGGMSKAVYILAGAMPGGHLPPAPTPLGSLTPGSSKGEELEGKMNRWVSFDFNEEIEFDIDLPPDAPLWCKYVQGAIDVFNIHLQSLSHSRHKFISSSYTLLMGGDLPIGAGVSSSSSLVCGVLFCLQQLHNTNLTREEIAILGSRVEREIIGLQGGIMDQYAIMLSQRDKVMMLDCRDRSYNFFNAAIPGTSWVLINTKVKHQLIDSDYNQRADECKQAVRALQKTYPDIRSLRDVTIAMLNAAKISSTLDQRSRFVIEENHRVEEMVIALSHKDAVRAGQLLKESHHGLQYLYEVSCDELDHLADMANNTEGVCGGRMMGGGFGGCVICLVKEDYKDVFLQKAIARYAEKFGFKPEVIEFELDAGVSRI